MREENKKGQTMKLLSVTYDFSDNPFKKFGGKYVLSKQDYKAIETHKYTKEELALIEIQEIKREIQEKKREIQVIERRIEVIEQNLQSEEET